MNNFIKSLNDNKVGILFILFASLTTAFGQMFWKMSEGNLIIFILIGFLLYFLGAGLMIVAFRFGSLSVLHPILSMGYVFAIFIGVIFLEEIINVKQIAGIVCIILGAILIGGGDN
ncbi:drug/metabolite transporter (DMT)-like permease [Neobacillus niacini]|uniref:DMT family transporter n=1 Tax=Neobacillus niacini TaxID=86668 RepID=UPI0028645996|nr:DMT family transporter [Neobacillus niacini]MDR7078832.1 drug/metabolite transporter (DMT)-like permease [Neobacillus niacini]